MIRSLRHVVKSLADLKHSQITRSHRSFLLSNQCACTNANFVRTKKDDASSSTLFKPVPIKLSSDDINVGAEITGTPINKSELLKILNRFSQKRETRLLCVENGMDREFCLHFHFNVLTLLLF